MIHLCLALPALLFATFAPRDAPFYTADSIVNSADGQPGPLAPTSIATIYGTGLAFVTRTLSGDDVRSGLLPTVLPGTGVTVSVGSLAANVFYVSPTQINFLVPSSLRPGPTTVRVTLNGILGPAIAMQLADESPALFQLDPQTVIAVRLDGSLITQDVPAKPNDIVVLYATGLGQTVPAAIYSTIMTGAAPILNLPEFAVLLDGAAVDRGMVLYAGAAPGFAGLYQINLLLPPGTGVNPQIQIGVGSALSPANLTLPVKP